MRFKVVIKRIIIGIVIFFVAMCVFGFILQKMGYQPPPKPEPVQDAITETPKQQPDPAEPQAPQSVAGEPQPVASEAIDSARTDIDSGTSKTESDNIQVQKPITPLFDSVRTFQTAFNKSASLNKFGFQLPNLKVQEGEVNNVFQCKFTDNLILMGTVDKTNKGVKEITMMGQSDGTLESSTNLILCMAVIIASADSSLLPEQRGDILRELGFLGADNADIMNLSAKTEKNGLEYFINSSPLIGIIFGVSRK
jgi:hypothetical protein